MNVHSLCNVDNELNVGIIVIVGAAGNLYCLVGARANVLQLNSGRILYLDVLICHPDVIGVGIQIFRRGHHCELYSPLVAKRFVGPFSYRPYLFDCCNAIIRYEDLAKLVSGIFLP